MATDGVKIIDSDTANDTYWTIMDLYDKGATIETIRNKIPFPLEKKELYDEFEYEIYVTSYALAIWEIGYMTDNVLAEVKKVIEKGACVKVWEEQCNAKEGIARQKELEKLWNKISSINQKVRKIKKYKVVRSFLFRINDVLTFQHEDNSYFVTILLNIRQYRGDCTYYFGKILYNNIEIPTINDILNSEIIGRKIPTGIKMESILSMRTKELIKEEDFLEIYKKESERTGSFRIGMDEIGIDHKDLINFSDKFNKIGDIIIRTEFKETGSIGGASCFNNFVSNFKDLENYITIFKADKFILKDLIKK